MKQTSINKLSEIYNALMYPESTNHTNQSLADLIQQVMRAESPEAKAGKFDIFKYVCKEDDRPMLRTVFHDEGFKVASDAYILVAIKEGYPAEFEGKMLKADGSFEEGVYPEWRSVIPNMDGYEPYSVDPQMFYDWLTEHRAAWKAENGKGCKWQDRWQVKVGPAVLKAEYFDKLLTAMVRIETPVLMVKDAKRCVYAKTDAGTVMLMPVMSDCQSDDILNMA